MGTEENMKSGKIRSLSAIDIISDLPDHLIENILAKLPLRDAARTCVLSTRWRHSWVKVPELRLDSELLEQSLQTETQIGSRAKFAMIISHILSLHQGPITGFELDIRQLEGSPEVNSLIRFISRNEIKTFRLKMSPKEKYKLPSSIFTCLLLSQLELDHCQIPHLPSTFKGFSLLEALVLFDVIISVQQLRCMVSNSLSLKVLMLRTPIDILHLGIISPTLNLLLVQYLETKDYGQSEESMLSTSNFFGGLPCLQRLQLDGRAVRSLFAGGIPTRLLTLSADIKTIRLYGICLGEENQFSCVLCLLRSIPDLRELDFFHGTQSKSWNIRLINNLQEEEDYSGISLNSLKEVTMEEVVGGSSEMKLIKLVLAKSPSLRKMSIRLATSGLSDKGLDFFKEMSMFKRSASNVEVRHSQLSIMHCQYC